HGPDRDYRLLRHRLDGPDRAESDRQTGGRGTTCAADAVMGGWSGRDSNSRFYLVSCPAKAGHPVSPRLALLLRFCGLLDRPLSRAMTPLRDNGTFDAAHPFRIRHGDVGS